MTARNRKKLVPFAIRYAIPTFALIRSWIYVGNEARGRRRRRADGPTLVKAITTARTSRLRALWKMRVHR